MVHLQHRVPLPDSPTIPILTLFALKAQVYSEYARNSDTAKKMLDQRDA